MTSHSSKSQETSNLTGIDEIHTTVNYSSKQYVIKDLKFKNSVSQFGVHACHFSAIYKCAKGTRKETLFIQLCTPDVASAYKRCNKYGCKLQ